MKGLEFLEVFQQDWYLGMQYERREKRLETEVEARLCWALYVMIQHGVYLNRESGIPKEF